MVRPYPMLEHVVVVLARTLDNAVKRALVFTGPELPMRVMFDEPFDRGDRCTHRVCVEPDEREEESVRVVLRGRDSENVEAERTVRWDGDPARKEELITAIRELAGLDAA